MTDSIHPDVVAALDGARRLTEQYADAQDQWNAIRISAELPESRGRVVVDGYGRVVDVEFGPGALAAVDNVQLGREVSRAARDAVARSSAARGAILGPLGIQAEG